MNAKEENWISVSDRLPNQSDHYTVKLKSGVIKLGLYLINIHGNGDWSIRTKPHLVTHWLENN